MKKFNSLMGKMMTFVMLNCEKATFLLSKKDIVELNFIEKVKLKMHLVTCNYCRHFAKQSALITKQVNSISIIDPNNLKLKLTEDQKVCMQHEIDNQLGIK